MELCQNPQNPSYDIPTLHNQFMKSSEGRFCDAFEQVNTSLGWAPSSCFTILLKLSDDRAMITMLRAPRPFACKLARFGMK